jgi:hypothetical protein
MSQLLHPAQTLCMYMALMLATVHSGHAQTEGEGNAKLKETKQSVADVASAAASGSADGVVFVSGVAGMGQDAILQVAIAILQDTTGGTAEWVDAKVAGLNKFSKSLRNAVRRNADVSELAALILANSDILSISTDDVNVAIQKYSSGLLSKEQFSQALIDSIPVSGELGRNISGIINHTAQQARDTAALRRFVSQVESAVDQLTLIKDIKVAYALQGSIDGMVTGSINADLPADFTEKLRQLHEVALSDETKKLLENYNMANLVAGVNIDIPQDPPTAQKVPVVLDPASVDIEPPTYVQPFLSDTDGDGLYDTEEIARGTDPNNPDSDGDTLIDGAEVSIFGSDPTLGDTDGDLVSDSIEVALGEDPAEFTEYGKDTDNDGIPDDYESPQRLGTDPNAPDTDGDGYLDGFEIAVGNGFANDPLVRNAAIEVTRFTVSPIAEALQTWRVDRHIAGSVDSNGGQGTQAP